MSHRPAKTSKAPQKRRSEIRDLLTMMSAVLVSSLAAQADRPLLSILALCLAFFIVVRR